MQTERCDVFDILLLGTELRCDVAITRLSPDVWNWISLSDRGTHTYLYRGYVKRARLVRRTPKPGPKYGAGQQVSAAAADRSIRGRRSGLRSSGRVLVG